MASQGGASKARILPFILTKRDVIVSIMLLVLAVIVVRFFNQQPAYTDAFYHYNAAYQIATGRGFVDHYLWTYIGAPDALPAPSHLYWMPLTSIIAAVGMVFFGPHFAAAQIGLILMLWLAALVAYALGWRIGGALRFAFLAALLVVTGGFFMRFWGTTDTFAPYAFLGSACLGAMGLGLTKNNHQERWWMLAGGLAALGHLTRSDGLLLLLVGWLVLFWPLDLLRSRVESSRSRYFAIFTLVYIVVMMPWFLRNLDAIGTPLPVGGMQAIWYTHYDDVFNYPPGASAEDFFADGMDVLIESRLNALGMEGALGTFIAVESMIVFTPFVLIGFWRRRHDVFLRPVWIFALSIHLAFALVFTFPGMRGGLFHAVAALLPWWMVLGLVGADETAVYMARRRITWEPGMARWVFTVGFTAMAIGLSVWIALPQRSVERMPPLYTALKAQLPDDARVLINDPAQLYYYTSISGVVLPNAKPDTLLTLAGIYDVGYLILEPPNIPAPLRFDADALPDFLTPLDYDLPGARIYAINRN